MPEESQEFFPYSFCSWIKEENKHIPVSTGLILLQISSKRSPE